MAQARDGNDAAVEELLVRHLPELRAYVRMKSGAKVRARESCSDLVQSVCREVLEDLGDLRADDPLSFRAWLFQVAHNKVLRRAEHLAAAKRDPDREVPQDANDDGDAGVLAAYATMCTPSKEAATREELERIERAMDQLSEEDRELIIQSRLIGRSHQELSATLEKSEVAVRKMLSRARSRLGLLLDSDTAHDDTGTPS